MLTVGELLRTSREKKGFTLFQVEKHTKIRAKFLQALEENKWQYFSSRIYIEGKIKNYAEFLGLESNKMLAFFRRDYEKKDDVRFKRKVASSYLTPETKKYFIISLIVIFLIFFGYFGYQLKLYLSPPGLTIISPLKAEVFREEKIKIAAKTEKDASITIFGERIFPNKEGIFEYYFPLEPGKNELIIELVGANGKKAVIKKTFIRTGR
ncbi:MAG: hypothetical protein US11_C0001G0066 [Candidatus Roizmanbacteria bacterium GW2011_GWA2_36_23]|uniref:Transcriptional regulator, XRE family n=1 Tax=Candidatus Roizmanbacteria bacterium GW2011_GWA2_36_23 TaxID=1618480 RepID=A0A0G0E9E0_9BACT|nr:MAG: hypothetical protein US11_C0001G0066 [Candidatus Roizmanbacteria bacterium GW2011_GWA2_36_23]